MTPHRRIIVNTIAQYVKTAVNVVFALWATRIVLRQLGEADFGIYSLVAGVVMLMSFATTAMGISTQRFLSVERGGGDDRSRRKIFSAALMLHLFMAAALLILLLGIGFLIFHFHLLNIAPDRLSAGYMLFVSVSAISAIGFCTSPFKALTVAHENLVFTSIVDICDGALKLGAAFLLLWFAGDHLVVYGVLLVCVSMLQFVVYASHCFYSYKECGMPRMCNLDAATARRMMGFAGWTVYDTGCTLMRVQGLALVLNYFIGTVANTAWGIAQQVNAGLLFISYALLNAMSPRIMMAHGSGDRGNMLRMSREACRWSLLLLAPAVLPAIAQTPALLTIWLGECPPMSVTLTRIVLLAALCNMLTLGLKPAVQAIGRMKRYTLIIATPKLLTLPTVAIMLYCGVAPEWAMMTFPAVELLCALMRIPVAANATGLNMVGFIADSSIYTLLPVLLLSAFYGAIRSLPQDIWIMAAAGGMVVYVAAVALIMLLKRRRMELSLSVQ